MENWQVVLETTVVTALCLLALLIVSMLIRRYVIISHGGVFDCGLRRWQGNSAGGWALGMARYSGNLFKWYRMFSLIPRHSFQLRREEMVLMDQRRMDAMESLQLFDDQYVVELKPMSDGRRVDLSMTQASLLGLSSWLQAAPFGYRYDE